MYCLGVDIGGTTTKAGLIDESGRILKSSKVPTVVDDLNGFLSTLAELIRDFQKAAAIDAVGIGIPGFQSSKTRIIETSPNIPCLHKVSLETMLADQVQMPVVTRNDANAAAYGEFLFGAGRGAKHMVYLTVGTGLGSGLILNGKLFEGASGYGAEFGHTVIDPDGRMCGCGNKGCLETVVSATGMVITAKEKLKQSSQSLLRSAGEPLTSEAIFDAAARGDETALGVFQETGRFLGIACASLIYLLNPEAVVIGGGVMASGELLLQPAREEARKRAFGPAFDDCQIVKSKLWPEAGVVGAAMLARDR